MALATIESRRPEDEVMAHLDVDEKGRVRNTIANVVKILKLDPTWRDRFAFDEFARGITIDGERLVDATVTEIRLDICSRYDFEPAKAKVWEVANLLAQRSPENPLVDYLEGLRWDGTERIEEWLVHSLGVDDTPINRVMSRKFCIGAVARALNAGCKLDTVLLLVGAQGIGKSTAFRLLAGDDWFSDTEITLGGKDAFMQTSEAWIYELAEMTSLHKSRRERVKSFISSATDSYRPPYGRLVVQVPRHTVFVASTNEETPLDDPTGSRRFWPISTPGPLDLLWLEESRDQIWAEAVAAYKAGEIWHLTDDEETVRQRVAREFENVDSWTSHVEAWATGKEKFTIRECLAKALQIPVHRQGREHQNRVGAVLRRLGYTKQKAKVGEVNDGSRPWLWFREVEADTE